MASNESKIPVGTILVGKYRVVREIGRGGMAAVYEAEQLSLGKKVAVKILAAELAASTIVIERFFREARAAASVKSPYIVDVYDSGRLDDGRPFIAMELLEGESLYDRMARVRIIDVETTIRVVVHTARGLVKAHAAGIVHRDLKPENIFLTKGEDGDDICKILDFGLAKFYAPVNPEEKAQKRLTREGAVFGTPAYMSPEQVKGQGNVDHRADLWALGCMAYECLIGRPVWNMDQGVAMTFASIATGPIPVPSQARADLPPAFDAWFKKCLERDPGKRYQSAKELSDAFVESWGQRPHSSHSFPNVMPHGAIPGSGGHAPANPFAMSGELQTVPSAGASTRRGLGNEPVVNGGNGANMRGSVASDASVPLPLVTRTSTDTPGTSEPEAPAQPKKVSPVRMAISGVALAAALTTAIFVWVRSLSPQVFAPIVQSTATAAPSGDPSANLPLGPAPDEPKWAPMIADGQKLFTAGNFADAKKKFEDVINMGGQAARVGQVYFDQTRVAEKATGSCKPASFSRPRFQDQKRAERPAIAATSKGAVVAWIDDHEQEKKDHVYATLLDNTGKPVGNPRDLTPEAAAANRPQIAAAGSDRLVLLYWDEKGKEAGIRARLLDADGRIDKNKGASVLVGAARPGQFWPAIDKGPQAFFVVWQDDRDKENDFDLYARRVPFDLEMAGTKETRLTDYNAPAKSKAGPPRVRYPAVAVVANTLVIAYRLEKEKEKEKIVVRMRVPLGDFDKGGLEESKDPNRTSRELGDVSLVSEDRSPADAPAVACGPEGCFIVWHGDSGGAWAAMIDPQEGRVIWRKKFSDKGGRPSLGVNEGQVTVAYYEKGLMKMALLTGDGVGASSPLFRIFDEKNVPRPYLSAGVQKNEWQLAWQDSDVPRGLGEVYAARVVCR
jgi:eukaryotic-like serine/threonine-protein kinase